MAGQVFLISRLLADKHYQRFSWTLAKDGLCCIAIQVAPLAILSGARQRWQSALFGQKLGGGAVVVLGHSRSPFLSLRMLAVRRKIRLVAFRQLPANRTSLC